MTKHTTGRFLLTAKTARHAAAPRGGLLLAMLVRLAAAGVPKNTRMYYFSLVNGRAPFACGRFTHTASAIYAA